MKVKSTAPAGSSSNAEDEEEEIKDPPSKKLKSNPNQDDDCILIQDTPPLSSVEAPPTLFHLTKVRGIPDRYNDPRYTVGIKGEEGKEWIRVLMSFLRYSLIYSW